MNHGVHDSCHLVLDYRYECTILEEENEPPLSTSNTTKLTSDSSVNSGFT